MVLPTTVCVFLDLDDNIVLGSEPGYPVLELVVKKGEEFIWVGLREADIALGNHKVTYVVVLRNP